MMLMYPALPGLTWKATVSPRFNTSMQNSVSGREFRASLMANPMYWIELEYEFLRTKAGYPELQTLMGFYMQRKGPFEAFLFRFDEDYKALEQVLTSEPGNKFYQLLRSFGGAVEPVQNIESAEVRVGGVVKVPGVDYTLSDTGLITFSAVPVGVVTWSGTYWYRCRFADDELDFSRIMKNFWASKTVKLSATLGTRI